ncbi:SagB family peptide dehydrogenase [Fictibacillus phosphorivorans]|uniref:SagB family peptide dehydrogenase n=1 Tax=Fictibacillus phosphorivorans TaxID=1221500 RepID=UPI0012939D4E|nr:SagB family peptide dehydrogenase [Fictibacillus phosphorivorans]MQR94491.1 SagB/ThcOx family dehydrogenase [Fictibacillus phosphorivorans]
MNLDEFIYKLHYETAKITPPDWEVNWEDAPLPYKLYTTDLPVVELTRIFSDTHSPSNRPTLADLSQFLMYSYGITQLSESFLSVDSKDTWMTYRRYVPSGGALYPSEVYLYLKLDELPSGIYHYDAAHHSLICLREGNFDDYLNQALGNRCDVSKCFTIVFVSTFFWKNFFKYHNFSYRLQGLDAGFLIGQMLEVGKRKEFETGVYYQFLDEAINHLIGLHEDEESVYAVLPLSIDKDMKWFVDRKDVHTTSAKLCEELEPLHHQHYMKSKVVRPYPMLLKMNQACFLHTLTNDKKRPINNDSSLVKVPQTNDLTNSFSKACKDRYSPGQDFVLKPLQFKTLSNLFNVFTLMSHYRNDIDQDLSLLTSRVSLRFTSYGVEGLANGMYEVCNSSHEIKLISHGDYRMTQQDGLLSDFVNMAQIPLSFNFSGSNNHYQELYNYRGHRIQHMEAGILAQKLILAVSLQSMNGHPVLGFNVPWYDGLFQLGKDEGTSLLQIPVGYHRTPARLQSQLDM